MGCTEVILNYWRKIADCEFEARRDLKRVVGSRETIDEIGKRNLAIDKRVLTLMDQLSACDVVPRFDCGECAMISHVTLKRGH